MGISPSRICVYVVVIAYLYTGTVNGNEELRCTGDTYYKVKKNGEAICKDCPSCYEFGGGIGWDTSVKRLEDEHGFTTCYPCDKCRAGTFREFGSYDSNCKDCKFDCRSVNRYLSVRCGGAHPGHCGDCFTGYYAESKESNSMCTQPTTTDKPLPTIIMESIRQAAPEFETKPRLGENTDGSSGDVKGGNPMLILYTGVMVFGIVVLIGCAVYAALHKKKTRSSTLAQDVSSKQPLFGHGSNGSNLGEEGLETDGGGNVRGEQPVSVSIEEPEAMGGTGRQSPPQRTDRQSPPRRKRYCLDEYRDRVLDKADQTLIIVSIKVSGEQRHELFQSYLKLEKSKTDPEEEQWQLKIITFPDYILNVLKIWLQINDKDATLKALCKALELASFEDVVEEILADPENTVLKTNDKVLALHENTIPKTKDEIVEIG